MNFNDLQKQVSGLIDDPNAATAAYLNLEKNSTDILEIPDYVKRPKIAFLSNFTIQGLPGVIKVRGIFHNLWVETYLAPYNQYAQEILNPDSQLHSFSPDLIYLVVDLKTLPNAKSLTDLIDQLLLRTKAKIIVFDNQVAASYANNRQVLLFDFANWLSKSGNNKYWYTKYMDLGDLRLSPEAFPDLTEALLRYAVAVSGATKKCVVVDLDNTFWKGILGEDGPDKIVPNRALQEHLLELYNKGVILAINSRNNLDEALQVIETHPKIILRKKHFAAWQINWGDKTSNMLVLARELNIGIDSFVFIDDDPFQQNLIRQTLPAVTVIPWKNNENLLEFLNKYAGTNVLELTKEDIRRGQMYAEERSRKELQSVSTLENFLQELKLKTEVRPVSEETLLRTSQLTQKTNQFNLTTRRYSEEDLKSFLDSGWKIWTVGAKDRFGDYGIIGVVMVEPHSAEWRIDNLLLSCRILGRGVEKQLMDYLFQTAKDNNVRTIIAEYRQTAKNSQAEKFWDTMSFKPAKQTKDQKFYYINL